MKQTSVGAHGTVTNDRASLDSSVYIYGLMSWVVCMDDHENSVGANWILWKTQWVPYQEIQWVLSMKIQWVPSRKIQWVLSGYSNVFDPM